MRGKSNLPYCAAVKLVGPDCAYHLYSTVNLEEEESRGDSVSPQTPLQGDQSP